jgi:Flp pilus assembly protein TadG
MVTQTLRRWRDRGAAAVEFAIVVPALIVLIFGSIEFGLAVNARTQVSNAAREGVRVASLGGSVADIQASALNSIGNVSGTKTVTVTCTTPGGATCTIGASNSGNTATVVVVLNYTGITGMFPSLTNTTITGTSYMRIEG